MRKMRQKKNVFEACLFSVVRTCRETRARFGGADRDRTDDLKLAKLALSQLSYGPGFDLLQMVGPGRVERPTSRLSGVRSNHLSYEPERGVDEPRKGFTLQNSMP